MVEDLEQPQRLTDRQKEVKERQQHEAALFPEIRSSPRTAPPVANRRLPTLALNSNDITGRLQEDEAISPSFPPDTIMNDFLGSSPTPSSSRKKSQEPYSDEGPPSSPPLIGSDLQIGPTSTSSNRVPEAHKGKQPQAQMDNADEQMEDSLPMLPEARSIDDQPLRTDDDPIQSDSALNVNFSNIDSNILSDMEVFVDAPSGQTNAAEDMNTTKDSSRASTENDEVTAQLMGEIAEASSQRSRLLQGNTDTTGKVSKKRMAKAADGSRKRKKAISSKENDSATSSSGEVVADCVLIDSRPRSSGMDTTGRSLKQEPDASPELEISVSELHEESSEVRERRKALDQIPDEGDKSDRPMTPEKGRARMKEEQDISRRSRRVTRTSSRLSDVATSSPIRSEASFASPEEAGIDAKWVSGPRGSRWAYIPATAPLPTVDQPALPPPSIAAANDDLEAATSLPAVDVTHARPSNLEPEHDDGSSEAPTPSSILEGLRTALENVKKVTLPPEEERAMVGILFESVHQVHEAGRRHRTL